MSTGKGPYHMSRYRDVAKSELSWSRKSERLLRRWGQDEILTDLAKRAVLCSAVRFDLLSCLKYSVRRCRKFFAELESDITPSEVSD